MKARLSVLAVVVTLALGVLSTDGRARTERVTTTIVVPESAAHAWEALEAFDELAGTLPLALRLGVPRPRRCTLEREGVGATRTCHFDGARIVQRVRVWEPPRRMVLDITSSDVLGGRISFVDASYVLRPAGASTRITRTTTYVSALGPALYWRPLEHWAVQAEHAYLLADVLRRARRGS